MKRAILSSLILAGTTLAASPAAAEECRCTAAVTAPEAYSEPDVLAHIVCAGSIDANADAEFEPTPLAEAPEAPLDVGEDGARPSPDAEPVPWCEGGDDPRCMPGQSGPAGQGNLIPMTPGFTTATQPFDEALSRPVTFASVEGAPRWGVRTRIERPPRA